MKIVTIIYIISTADKIDSNQIDIIQLIYILSCMLDGVQVEAGRGEDPGGPRFKSHPRLTSQLFSTLPVKSTEK